MMKKTLTIFFLVLAFPFLAHAQTGEESAGSHITAKLLSSVQGMGNLEKIDMGLALAMEDDWYTYWRMAGDSGLPPSFDWTGSQNVKTVDIYWPPPRRFAVFDINSFGYNNQIVLPLKVTPLESGKPMDVHLKLDIVICHDICIPVSLQMAKRIDAGNPGRTMDKQILDNAWESLARPRSTPDLALVNAVLSQSAIVVTAFSKNGFEDTDLIVEVPGTMITTPPEILRDPDDKTRAMLKISAPTGMYFSKLLFGKKAHITLTEGKKAVDGDFDF